MVIKLVKIYCLCK